MISELYKNDIVKVLEKGYHDDILELSHLYPEKRSLNVDFIVIEKQSETLADELIEDPESILNMFKSAITGYPIPHTRELVNIPARIVRIPNKIPIRSLRSKDISHFVAVEGIVRRATEVRPKIVRAAFRCMRCDNVTFVEQLSNRLDEPYSGCENENCMKRGPFKLVPEQSTFIDSQKVQIQELPESLRGGSNPQSIEVNIEEDLTGLLNPGDRVIINGILKSVQRPLKEGKSTFYDLVIDANSIERLDQEFDDFEVTAEEEMQILELSQDPQIYDKIVASIAPSIYGHEDVKRALMYQLFSGVVKQHGDGTRVRGDIHVILVGDPGVAKSQLLRYIVKLSPRGVFASGKSASASGLTAAAVRDDMGDGRWTIEGGALVMADMGIAAIDEMDKMRDEDKSSLHEAMEQQTVSLAKAGIIATLKTRCALLGAANPVYGRFNEFESLADQIDMPPALLSRFDLIFLLLDKPNEEGDERIARHVAQSHYAGELVQHRNIVRNPEWDKEFVESQSEVVEPVISVELLRKYIAYSKKTVSPVIEDDAREKLVMFYKSLRSSGMKAGAPVPVTARQLEALIRLAEAAARVRLDNHVTVEDAERAISLTMACLKNVGIDPETGKMDIDVIMVGTSKSQRDKIGTLKEIIRNQQVTAIDAKAAISAVIAEAATQGISESDAESIIEKLNQRGEISKPDTKSIKLIHR